MHSSFPRIFADGATTPKLIIILRKVFRVLTKTVARCDVLEHHLGEVIKFPKPYVSCFIRITYGLYSKDIVIRESLQVLVFRTKGKEFKPHLT